MIHPPALCPSKFGFLSFILFQFAQINNIYFFIPHELIRLILLHYYLLETHFDISKLDIHYLGRDRLFAFLWKFIKMTSFPFPPFDIEKAKKCLISLPGSKEKTYISEFDGVYFNLDIYNKNGFINVSYFNNNYGKNNFKYVFDIPLKSYDRPTFRIKNAIEDPKYHLQNPQTGDKVLILDEWTVSASGVIIQFIKYKGKKYTQIKITQLYSILNCPERNRDYLYISSHSPDFKLAYYSEKESVYVFDYNMK